MKGRALEQFAEPIAWEALSSIGVRPESQMGLRRSWLREVVRGLTFQKDVSPEELFATHYEVDTWGRGWRISYVTGRQFYRAQPVLVHNPRNDQHEIIGKGILTSLSLGEGFIRNEDGIPFIYSGAQPYVIFTERLLHTTPKIGRLEPIRDQDLLLTIEDIRAKRIRNMHTAELIHVSGGKTVGNLLQRRIAFRLTRKAEGRDSQWLFDETAAWKRVLEQICEDNDIEDPIDIEPWMELSPMAQGFINIWKEM